MLEPSFVAEETVKAVQKNKVLCVLPDSGRILLPLKRCEKFNWSVEPNGNCLLFLSLKFDAREGQLGIDVSSTSIAGVDEAVQREGKGTEWLIDAL